jgi:hypothetical protein
MHLSLAMALLVWLAQGWLQSFGVNEKALATEGTNPYFVLKPGFRATFQGRDGRLVITVLDETLKVGGVNTRVVEEREWRGEQLVEVSRNYFAIDPGTTDVFYFGEDVDVYKDGKVITHEGSWRHGTGGASFGMMMPGRPAVGMKYFQEQARGIAMDRAEILSVDDRIATPAGKFSHCLRTLETTPLEKLSREYKVYAPGVGLIKDGDMQLVSHTYVR